MELIEKVCQAGVVGAGGAGFPTHVKLDTQSEWYILNGAECEPLIHSDKYLMRTRAKDIVDVLELVGKQVGASQLAIGLKKTYTAEIEALTQAIGNKNIKLILMSSFYPAGDEQTLIFEATGRTVPPGGLPKEVGVTVSNISTICSIADALKDHPVTTRVLSIMGEVNNPCIIEAPIGTSVLECLQEAKVKLSSFSVLVGGPMMGKIYPFKDVETLVITKTVNSLVVLPENHYLEQRQNINPQHMINQTLSACIQCRECTEMCPRFLIGHPLHPHRVMRSIAFGKIDTNPVFEESLLCCECGVCDYVCPMHLSPRRVNQMVKRELAGKKRPNFQARPAVEQREYRKLSTDRLAFMIDVALYKKQEPKTEIAVLAPKKVAIPLRQHIGKESVPVVSVGDKVSVGNLVADIAPQALGAKIHASISGTVIAVDAKQIVLQG